MNYIDSLLNKITMYRLTLYYLIFLVGVAVVFSFIGLLNYNGFDIAIEALLSVIVCWVSNWVFAKFFGAVTNIESVFITALILTLIIPIKFPTNSIYIFLASGVAMGTKYFLTIDKRHIFNPAAASVAMIAMLFSEHQATWWIGTPAMMIPVLLGGYLVLRRIRREEMVLTFLAVYLLMIAVFSLFHNGSFSAVLLSLDNSFTHSALLFFALVMFTEPLTTPGTKHIQRFYAILVAILYSTPQIRLTPFTLTPELALCTGNLFSYILSPYARYSLPLQEKLQLSKDTLAFVFNKDKKFKYKSGQYMEWTLPHEKTDNRGNRRYFSLASSPTEDDLMIIVKFPEKSSSFKKALLDLPKDNPVVASQIAGDFTLPQKLDKPLVFVAGGVGIAPFRSMLKYIIDKQTKVNIVLLYSVWAAEDILFQDVLKQSSQFGVKTVITLTKKDEIPANWQGETGFINQEMVQRQIPDFKNRTFYISGPQLMVENFEEVMKKTGVPSNQIITDYFPGYAEKK